MAGDGWMRPNRLSRPPNPPVISCTENNRIMEEQKKKVDSGSSNKNNKPSCLSNINEEKGDKEDKQETGTGACDSPLSAIASLRSRSPAAQC